MVLHHFSAAIIIGLFFCSFPLNAEAAGWLNYACLFVGFITEADVSAGIMEDVRVLLCCWVFFSLSLFLSSCSLVGEMMSTFGSLGSI